MIEEKKAEPNYITWEELRNETRYLREDIRSLKKQLKIVMGVLVDKKLIGEQLAKAFSETCSKEVLEWFLKTQEK